MVFEEVVAQIVEAIRAGDLRAGDKLLPERKLAAQMGISRPTLREAIKVLSEAGVIEVRPGPRGGNFVRSEVVPPGLVERRLEMPIEDIFGLLEARRLFEPRVAQLAALYATEDDFAALRRTIELSREAANDRARFLQLDHRFHLGIARATKNSTIVDMTKALLRRMEVAQDVALRRAHEPEWSIDIHERTLRAIMSGDPEMIEVAMDEHLSFLERIWEEESGRPRLREIPEFLRSHAGERLTRSSK